MEFRCGSSAVQEAGTKPLMWYLPTIFRYTPLRKSQQSGLKSYLISSLTRLKPVRYNICGKRARVLPVLVPPYFIGTVVVLAAVFAIAGGSLCVRSCNNGGNSCDKGCSGESYRGWCASTDSCSLHIRVVSRTFALSWNKLSSDSSYQALIDTAATS